MSNAPNMHLSSSAGAHNSHLGDARFTDMGKSRGEVNLGQLTRQRWGPRLSQGPRVTDCKLLPVAPWYDRIARLVHVSQGIHTTALMHV